MTRVFGLRLPPGAARFQSFIFCKKFGWAEKAVESMEKLPHKTLQLSHTSHSLYYDYAEIHRSKHNVLFTPPIRSSVDIKIRLWFRTTVQLFKISAANGGPDEICDELRALSRLLP